MRTFIARHHNDDALTTVQAVRGAVEVSVGYRAGSLGTAPYAEAFDEYYTAFIQGGKWRDFL